MGSALLNLSQSDKYVIIRALDYYVEACRSQELDGFRAQIARPDVLLKRDVERVLAYATREFNDGTTN